MPSFLVNVQTKLNVHFIRQQERTNVEETPKRRKERRNKIQKTGFLVSSSLERVVCVWNGLYVERSVWRTQKTWFFNKKGNSQLNTFTRYINRRRKKEQPSINFTSDMHTHTIFKETNKVSEERVNDKQ